MTTSQLLEVLIRGAVRGEISISVSLAPGETLEIDTEKLLAEIENSNAMPNYTGDWPDLIPGDNVFIYSDSESSRSIEVVITKKDRFI